MMCAPGVDPLKYLPMSTCVCTGGLPLGRGRSTVTTMRSLEYTSARSVWLAFHPASAVLATIPKPGAAFAGSGCKTQRHTNDVRRIGLKHDRLASAFE